MNSFAERLVAWHKIHGRHDLPWQRQDAYHVWLSEIMLQQTQVVTVIPYYLRFVASFPSIAALAAATEEEILTHWSGLGYYARGRNLHKAARIIVREFGGEFPRRFEDIIELPGVGRSTAAAICALAYHECRAILDGNVKRVLARHAGIDGWPGDKRVEGNLWQQAEALFPSHEVAAYTQALMDLGATLCTRSKPRCFNCPVQGDCVAFSTNRTGELPASRPRKSIPEHQVIMLLVTHDNDILLEKRPSTGIWGGLWSLPQFDDELAAKSWFMRNALIASEGERMKMFSHSFTHFRLHISPLKIQLAHKPSQHPRSGSIWLDMKEASGAAIPVPVRKILNDLD